MATRYRSRKDSTDDGIIMDEKGYSEDEHESPYLTAHGQSNHFMHQVHKQRRHSLSYSKHSDSSPQPTPTTMDDELDLGPTTTSTLTYSEETAKFSLSRPRALAPKLSMEQQRAPTLQRRHSADKILSKPSTKNVNSVDYLNRMVITLRARITTLKEDLRIAAELGQKLFSQNAHKEVVLKEQEQRIKRLRAQNDEISMMRDQLLQSTQLDAEHTKRLETDLNRQKSKHTISTSEHQAEADRLREELQHKMADFYQLQQLTERQRLQIETLETRNEQIAQNATETIDDLSEELAEEKDGHSTLKRKYQRTHGEMTRLKIKFEKRGTEIGNLKKSLREKELQLLSAQSSGNGAHAMERSNEAEGMGAQKMKLLYRQIENYKDEMEGISKHLEHCKAYLKNTVHLLEATGLRMQSPLETRHGLEVDDIYALCHKSRQFLGIDQPPPDPVYPEQSPDAPPPEPREPSQEPPPADDDDTMTPSMPRDRTPPVEVRLTERVPLSVPAPPTPSTAPPSEPQLPPSSARPTPPVVNGPTLSSKITATPSMPVTMDIATPSMPTAPSIPSVPEEPQDSTKPPLPLPPPKTPKAKPKTHALGIMPSAVSISPITPVLPAPASPKHRHFVPPSIPEAAPPESYRFNNAMTPEMHRHAVPRVPDTMREPPMPSLPTPPTLKSKVKRRAMAVPDAPPPAPYSEPSPPPQPAMDSVPGMKTYSAAMRPAPSLSAPTQPPMTMPSAPSEPTERAPKSRVKAQPMTLPPPKQPSPGPPAMPSHPTAFDTPSLPNEDPPSKHRLKISAAAMAPPALSEPVTIPPPLNPQDPDFESRAMPPPSDRPLADDLERVSSHPLQGGRDSGSPRVKTKRKRATKRKKSKKVKRERDSMESQKQHLTAFFTTYSVSRNWVQGGKEKGVQKYVLQFAEREPLHARMAFLYSMTLYLGQIVGINKRCIRYAFMLLRSVQAQIDTLCEAFALILQTLEHHNDDKLWKYIYSFLYNAAAYFKHIQRFVGTRTSVDNPRRYSRALQRQNREYGSHGSHTLNRRESSFRRLSGFSEDDGQSIDYGNQSIISGMSDGMESAQ